MVGCLAILALLLGAAALVVGALLALRFGAPAWAVALGGIALLVAGFIWLQRSAARNR
ncbi:hypothetical protein [Nocardioides gilvus]|uniref:hypothetical protein n=1 Tax=Nocardioides gilvus TaxID=1735589 RepID=UPI0013A54FA6|nr:hypothetical protein [Nocardioides gilvus]